MPHPRLADRALPCPAISSASANATPADPSSGTATASTSAARSTLPAGATAKTRGHPGRQGTGPPPVPGPGSSAPRGGTQHGGLLTRPAGPRVREPDLPDAPCRPRRQATPSRRHALTRQRCHAPPAGNIPGRPASACQAVPARPAVRQEGATGAHGREGPADLRIGGAGLRADAMGVQVGSMGVQLGPKGRPGHQTRGCGPPTGAWPSTSLSGQAAPEARSLTLCGHRPLCPAWQWPAIGEACHQRS